MLSARLTGRSPRSRRTSPRFAICAPPGFTRATLVDTHLRVRCAPVLTQRIPAIYTSVPFSLDYLAAFMRAPILITLINLIAQVICLIRRADTIVHFAEGRGQGRRMLPPMSGRTRS